MDRFSGTLHGVTRRTAMTPYAPEIEYQMKVFCDSLSEKDRRRYAAIEATKLGHGGIEYVASVLGCHANTIRQGKQEVAQLPDDEAEGRVRKKGGPQES
jgi:hypothetical protein